MTATASATTTRGQRRRSATRTALVSAAERLFAERGADAVTIDEIVAAADVAKGSFYNHFESRDDLARHVSRQVREEIEAAIGAANAGEPDPAVRMIRAHVTALAYAAAAPIRAAAQARLLGGATSAHSPMNAGVTADLTEGLQAGRFQGVTVEGGVVFVLGVAVGAIAALLDAPSAERARALAADLGPALLKGLGMDAADAARLTADAIDRIIPTGGQP